MPRYTEGFLKGLQLPRKPRSPYYLLKNAIKKSKERNEARELQRQIQSMQVALKSYRQKSEDFLVVAEAAFPRLKDINGDMRHEKDFTVKPRPDGTFSTPRRCRPLRWKGKLTGINETEEDVTIGLTLPSFKASRLTVTQPEPDTIEV